MMIDFRVLELLSSKICHDLVSPVSAINNGVELIEDIGGDVVDEAMKLIGSSAVNASRRLRLFRMAYGRAGSEGHIPLRDVRQTVEQYFQETKITLVWPDSVPSEALQDHKGALKTLINLLLVGEELLAYGGTLTLRAGGPDSPQSCVIDVVGRNAQLQPPSAVALDGTCAIEELSPRTIQSYVTGRFAESFGLSIASRQTEQDHFSFHLALSSPEYHVNP